MNYGFFVILDWHALGIGFGFLTAFSCLNTGGAEFCGAPKHPLGRTCGFWFKCFFLLAVVVDLVLVDVVVVVGVIVVAVEVVVS